MSDISRPLYLSSPPRRIRAFCMHTEVITHRTEHQPPPLFIYGLAHTRTRTHCRNHTRTTSYLGPPTLPRGRVGFPCTGHDSSSTPTPRLESRDRAIVPVVSRARHTRPRRAKRSRIMLARTSVPTRTVATFERYARDARAAGVIAANARGVSEERRARRRRMRRMRPNGGMTTDR